MADREHDDDARSGRGSAVPRDGVPVGRAGVTIRRDAGVLVERAAEIDELHDHCEIPVTSRRLWLQSWYRSFPYRHPLVIAVDGPGGDLDALACLATTPRLGTTSIVAGGHLTSDYVAFAARTPDAATLLVDGILDALDSDRPWVLHLRQLLVDDPVLEALRRRLGRSQLVQGTEAFAIPIGTDRRRESVLGKSYRRDIRRKVDRLAAAGHELRREVVVEGDRVAALLPAIEDVHRRRDEQLDRTNRLGDPHFVAFLRDVLESHARAGQLELATVFVDGELAAYDATFVDVGARRVWNGRIDPDHLALSPGKLSFDLIVDRALDDPDCGALDLMVGDELYKRQLGAEAQPLVDLHAASSGALGLATSAPRRAKELLRPLRANAGIDRVWRRVHRWWRRRGRPT